MTPNGDCPYLSPCPRLRATAALLLADYHPAIRAIGSTHNLTMDPFEKYDMTFNGAVATRNPTSSPGRYSGMDNGWAISLMDVPLTEFNKSIVKYPSIKRFPGGASNDLLPNLQHPEDPVPALDPNQVPTTIRAH